MIQVKFLTDYRGVLTGERFYEAGEVAEFEDKQASQLIKDNRAELVVAEKADPSPTTTTTTKRTRTRKKAA